MPRWVKVLIWIVVFAAFAGAGAYAASRTDPFPPGVEDPGARDDADATPDGSGDVTARWRLVLTSESRRDYRVGGVCTTSWRGVVPVLIEPEGVVTGEGIAELSSPVACDFPTAQVQAETVVLLVTGLRTGDDVSMSFGVTEPSPPGAGDQGGFRATIDQASFEMRTEGDQGRVRFTRRMPDGVGGTTTSTNVVSLRCRAGCAG